MALASKTGEVKFNGKGDPGTPGEKGARMRMTEWTSGKRYLQGKQGESFYDVAVYNNLLYLCLVSHDSSSANNPQTSVAQGMGYWEVAQDWAFVATKLLLAQKINASEINVDSLLATGQFNRSSNVNLLRNSGMYDTDGWLNNNSPTSVVYQGYECMRCTVYGTGRYTTDGRNVSYDDLPSNGSPITISADVYVTVSCYLYLGFEQLSPSVQVTETGKWIRVSHTQTVASTKGNFVVYLMSSGVTAYIRNVKLEAGSTATTWTSADNELLRTGINLKDRQIIFTADNVLVRDNEGNEMALFSSDGSFIKAQFIDVDNLQVKKLKGATGTFYNLQCLDNEGNVAGQLRFSTSGQFYLENMNMMHQGSVEGGYAFYGQNVFVRSSFGAAQRTLGIIYDYKVEMFREYGNANVRDTYQMTYTTYEEHAVYRVPGYGTMGHTAGMPVDTFLFFSDYNNKYYQFDLYEGQRIVVFNSYNAANHRHIYINGSDVLINGGEAVIIQQTRPSWIGVDESLPGAGQYIISRYDNNW